MKKEYIERGAADIELQNLVREYNKNCESDKSSGAFEALYRLRLTPAEDVVEVVRCKDCKHAQLKKSGGFEGWICEFDTEHFTSARHFCSLGERSVVDCRSQKDRTFVPENKKILDATCGSRTIWFNKNHPNAIYCDIREQECTRIWKSGDGLSERSLVVDPDIVCDFTKLPFEDESFSLVVFDPPHLQKVSETAWLYQKYGKLDESWPQMLRDGFGECMRVLKPNGVLIFKWSEYDIPADKVWKAIGEKPLFGHHSGKKSKTFWGCFMKLMPEATLAERREESENENLRNRPGK